MPPRRWKTNTGIIGRPHAKSVRYEDRGIVKAAIGVLGRSSVLVNSQPSLRSSLVLQFLHARFEERNRVRDLALQLRGLVTETFSEGRDATALVGQQAHSDNPVWL